MQWLASNVIETVLIIGIVLLIIEVAVLGFSTFFLFFAGLAAVTTSVVMWVGILPETFIYAIFSIAAFTVMYSVLLWKPLSRMQKDVDTTRASTDLSGHTFVLTDDIEATLPISQKPSYQYSGITWQLDAHENISKGTLVEVVQADVGVFLVKPK